MRYTQDSGVRRKGDGDEYKVVVSVYLTPDERDQWGSGAAQLALVFPQDGECIPATATGTRSPGRAPHPAISPLAPLS